MGKLEKQLKPYFELWNNAYNLTNSVSSIKQDPICTLKYDEIKQQSIEFSKELQRLSSQFTALKNPSALTIL